MGRVLPGRRMEAMDTSAGQNTAQSVCDNSYLITMAFQMVGKNG